MENAQNVDIRKFYRENLGVQSEGLLDKLVEASQAVVLQKGEVLHRQGERQTTLPFLLEGEVHCTTMDDEGKEHTIGFGVKYGDILLSNIDLTGYQIGTATALVPTTAIILPMDFIEQNFESEPEVARLYNEQVVKWGKIYQERALNLSKGSATERYNWFCSEYPGLLDTVNNRYIASFLGVTPVTLSRLRHGVATKAGREQKASGQ